MSSGRKKLTFVDQIAFDGMRKHLMRDFTQVYHLDLHGNVRKNPKLSGTTHNVFGIQIGVGITIAIRNAQNFIRTLHYYRVPEDWRRTKKLSFLKEKESINGIEWGDLQPDERQTWNTEGLKHEFSTFLPVGIKELKASAAIDVPAIFIRYSGGVKTNRDAWAYDFSHTSLEVKMRLLVDTYNSDVDRWRRRGDHHPSVDDFVTYDDAKIKWSGDLKGQLTKGKYASYSENCIRHSLYRPFVKKYLYFDTILNNSIYLQHLFFPEPKSEQENRIIWLKVGSEWPMFALATNVIPDLLPQGGSQCFPYYTYAADGTNRRENITDWALKQFQDKYGPTVSKWDIFHYVYGLLHHPLYRQRYAENLKRDLPHIPLLHSAEAFRICVSVGKQLMEQHLNYETADEYELTEVNDGSLPYDECQRVEKMRLTAEKTAVIVNKALTLTGIPQECFAYRLGNRCALEWVIDQYQVTTDKRSGIVSDPNRSDDPEYIVRLVKQVVMVSMKTVQLIAELEQAVPLHNWLEI